MIVPTAPIQNPVSVPLKKSASTSITIPTAVSTVVGPFTRSDVNPSIIIMMMTMDAIRRTPATRQRSTRATDTISAIHAGKDGKKSIVQAIVTAVYGIHCGSKSRINDGDSYPGILKKRDLLFTAGIPGFIFKPDTP